MNNTTMKWMLTGALGIFIASVVPVQAQSTLGGAKTQQNKIGGVAKPAPVVGGASIHTPPPGAQKTGPVANLAKPGTAATTPPPPPPPPPHPVRNPPQP